MTGFGTGARLANIAKKKQYWNAYFYYQTAQFLLTPVDLLSSPNLEKLQNEQGAITPPGLPGAQPLVLTVNNQSWNITSLRTDASLGGLDLVIHFQATGEPDPVASRKRAIEVMKAMLSEHAELREAFHGLWVYADVPGQAGVRGRAAHGTDSMKDFAAHANAAPVSSSVCLGAGVLVAVHCRD